MAQVTLSLRELLWKSSEWAWGTCSDRVTTTYQEPHLLFSVYGCVQSHIPLSPLRRSSAFRLRAVLLHRQPDGEQRQVAFASGSFAEMETKFTEVGKEGLAVAWGAEHFQD